MSQIGSLNLQDIVELVRMREQAIKDVKGLLACKNTLDESLGPRPARGQIVRNDDNAVENMGFLPGGSASITLHLNQQ